MKTINTKKSVMSFIPKTAKSVFGDNPAVKCLNDKYYLTALTNIEGQRDKLYILCAKTYNRMYKDCQEIYKDKFNEDLIDDESKVIEMLLYTKFMLTPSVQGEPVR